MRITPSGEASSTIFDVRSPYCPVCGAGMCAHADRPSDPNADVPPDVQRELMACAQYRGMSFHYLCAIYRKGVLHGLKSAALSIRSEAHREVTPAEHAPWEGRSHGHCIVCDVPFPCPVVDPAHRGPYREARLRLYEGMESSTSYEECVRLIDTFEAAVISDTVKGCA